MLRSTLAVLMAGTLLYAQEAPPNPAASSGGPTAEAPAKAEATTPAPADASKAAMKPKANIAIEIDLTAQKAWILQEGQRVYETPISSGRTGYETHAGNFTVIEKDLDHKSSLYGKIVADNGKVLKSDADSATAVPAGAKFVAAPMKHFIRFDGAVGMHAGRLPGRPASHGCVRLPASKAALFYNIAEVGTPVRVFGKAPRTEPDRPLVAKVAAASPTPAPAVGQQKRGFLWFLKR